MISSLLMLSLTAFIGCTLAVPVMDQAGQPQMLVNNQSYSSFTCPLNNQTYKYYGGIGDFLMPKMTEPTRPEQDGVWGTYTSSYDGIVGGDIVNIMDGQQIQDFNSITNLYDCLDTYLNYSNLYWAYSRYVVSNNEYNFCRLIVPTQMNFTYVYIESDIPFGVYYGGYEDSQFLGNGTQITSSVSACMLSASSQLLLNNWTAPNAFHFQEYYFLFNHEDFEGVNNLDCYLTIRYLDAYEGDYQSGYARGYEDGYNNGYTNGLIENNNVVYQNGYNQGYADGLALANQGGFNALFGAIADTPIMFMRNLFSFDLFGMNVFIIIMSLLTGLVVIYVIKKVIH